jgi:hypothetical protein
MLQRILAWFVLACIIIWAVSHPETAAAIMGAIGHAINVFFTKLSS